MAAVAASARESACASKPSAVERCAAAACTNGGRAGSGHNGNGPSGSVYGYRQRDRDRGRPARCVRLPGLDREPPGPAAGRWPLPSAATAPRTRYRDPCLANLCLEPTRSGSLSLACISASLLAPASPVANQACVAGQGAGAWATGSSDDPRCDVGRNCAASTATPPAIRGLLARRAISPRQARRFRFFRRSTLNHVGTCRRMRSDAWSARPGVSARLTPLYPTD